jgi:glutathione S-transferase
VRLEEFPVMLLSYSVWVLGKRGERSADILADKVARAERYQHDYPALEREYRRKAEFFRAFRERLYDDDHVAKCSADSQAVLDVVTEQVRSEPWLCGGAFSFADCIAASTLYRLRDLGKLDAWAKQSDHPLNRYMARLEARESYRHVFVDDDLIPR